MAVLRRIGFNNFSIQFGQFDMKFVLRRPETFPSILRMVYSFIEIGLSGIETNESQYLRFKVVSGKNFKLWCCFLTQNLLPQKYIGTISRFIFIAYHIEPCKAVIQAALKHFIICYLSAKEKTVGKYIGLGLFWADLEFS